MKPFCFEELFPKMCLINCAQKLELSDQLNQFHSTRVGGNQNNNTD